MVKKQSLVQMKYDKTHIRQISLKLHKEIDKDILNAIDYLKESENTSTQGAIKKLIRKSL